MRAKIIKHYRQGTLLNVISNVLFSWLPKKKVSPPAPARIISRVTESKEEALEFLAGRVTELNGDSKTSLLIAGNKVLSNELIRKLNERSLKFKRISVDEIPGLSIDDPENTGCIFTSFIDAASIHEIGNSLLNNPSVAFIPFEYVCIPREEYSALEKYDHYDKFSFVSPLLISKPDHNSLYEGSLDRYGLRTPYFQYTAKCDIRDFMDLSQIVANVVNINIEGDIAEFGSYKGHSGFLISEMLKKLGSAKKLYMFDTFEEFPKEDIGIDSFWSKTHKVDFEEVKDNLATQDNIRLVKGDFTKTFPEQEIERLSFIYVDCDSYRSTKYLMEELFEKVLSKGGFMVFEDYGHPALLGNRLAIHRFFDGRKDCFKFFSQFSGYYIVIKL